MTKSWRWRGVTWVAACGAMAALVWTMGLARADSNKRAQLKSEIERLLQDIASELRDVPGDSSTSDLERTIDYAGRVSDKARELKNVAESDSDASRMASYYPDIARRYQDAARYLRELKNEHRRLDEHPRKCEDAMKELASRLRAFTDRHDPRGIEEVPKLAREFGRIGKTAVEQADGIKRATYERYDRVDDFSDSDGKWSDVRSYLHGAGRTMYEHAVRMHDQIKRDDVCGNLAKEDRNPLVEDAMKRLFEGKKGIELLYEAMDRHLAEVASNLDGLAGDSDDSDIRRAESKLEEVDRALDQLDRIRGNDSEARRRVETWKNLVRAAREALRHLRTLKQAQFLADRAPERCKETNDRLRQLIRDYVDYRKTQGITEIPARARAFAEPLKVGLTKTDEQHPIMERAFSDAQRFDPSEGRWRDVRDKLRDSATRIFEHWKRARETAHKECDELVKGDQNTEVKRAVSDLSRVLSTAETEMARLEADHRRWYDGLRELREWYKHDTKAVRDMFCNIPESPGDYAEGDAYAAKLQQIADRMRDRIAPKWAQLTNEAADLNTRARALMQSQDDGVRRRAENLFNAVTSTMVSLQNILNNELKGANDPEVRARIEFGKNEHKRIQANDKNCTAREVTFESTRVDCIKVDNNKCYIVEIKPNNQDAIKKGYDQVHRGLREIEYLLAGKKKKDELQGNLEVIRPCFDDSKQTAHLETKLQLYDFCPPEGHLHRDLE
jgi:uncharacterized protein YukE